MDRLPCLNLGAAEMTEKQTNENNNSGEITVAWPLVINFRYSGAPEIIPVFL